MSDDFMPMGMPPVMVDFEDMQQFMAQDERIKELQGQLDECKAIAQDLVDMHFISKDWWNEEADTKFIGLKERLNKLKEGE